MTTMNSGMGGPAGYGENSFSSTPKYSGDNDDGNVRIDITSVFNDGMNFFGTTYDEIYVSANGLITFGGAHDNDNDDGFGVINLPALAPFYSDLDIDQGGEVYWDFDTANGKITITWDAVEPYNYSKDKGDDDGAANSFQVVLTDLGGGDFNVEYIYEDIQDAYVGGDHAIAGFTDGSGTIYALEGSGNDTFMENNYATNDFDNGDPAGTFSFSTVNGTPDVLAVDGTSGNDSMGLGYTDADGDQITTGDDLVIGGDGNDNIEGDDGNDTLVGGAGADTLRGGDGNDLLRGGDGDDKLVGWGGNDTLDGGGGRDFFSVTDDHDQTTVIGGEGYDFIGFYNWATTQGVDVTFTDDFAGTADFVGSSGHVDFSEIEYVEATEYDDTIDGSATTEGFEAIGREGADIIIGGSGDDTLSGGRGHSGYQDENDTIFGGAGNDVLDGDDGDDSLDGGAGNDDLRGDAGDDRLDGGSGNDTLSGGTGDDTIVTGTGDDLIIIDQGDGNTTVTDFDIGDADGDGYSNDQLDVSDLRDLDGNPINIWDVIVTGDSSGNAVLTFPEGEKLTLEGVAPAQMTGQQMAASGIPCYAPGTLIDTPDGPRAVETLQPGDLVNTLDHGPQPIRWTRSGEHPLEKVDVDDKPVLIAANALGKGLPTQDLIVSPQHRMLVGGGGQLEGWFETAAFAPAKSLTNLRGIRHMKGKKAITWIHFACDRHEVIRANGCLSESLLLGPMVVNGLTGTERKALTEIYGPAPKDGEALNGPAARECLKVGDVRRHLEKCRNDQKQRIAKEVRKWDCDLVMERRETDRAGEALSRRDKRLRKHAG